jgi:uncharacterized protein YabN with tetrapyrrole methylase and pyrophosphatase domain
MAGPSPEAFAEALALQHAAAAQGFDWTDPAGLWDKLAEEIGELRQAGDAAARTEELGDLLFMVVNLARHLQVDPATALAQANRKFGRRFAYIMRHAAALPARGDARRLDAMEQLWRQAKRDEIPGA